MKPGSFGFKTTVTGNEQPQQFDAARASWNLFLTLGINPQNLPRPVISDGLFGSGSAGLRPAQKQRGIPLRPTGTCFRF